MCPWSWSISKLCQDLSFLTDHRNYGQMEECVQWGTMNRVIINFGQYLPAFRFKSCAVFKLQHWTKAWFHVTVIWREYCMHLVQTTLPCLSIHLLTIFFNLIKWMMGQFMYSLRFLWNGRQTGNWDVPEHVKTNDLHRLPFSHPCYSG